MTNFGTSTSRAFQLFFIVSESREYNCPRNWRGSSKVSQVATDHIARRHFYHCSLTPRQPRRYTIEKKLSVSTGYRFSSPPQTKTVHRNPINLRRQSHHWTRTGDCTCRDCKSWCKSIWSSTKRKSVRVGPVFSKKKGKVVFQFQHFVKPERIIEEYARVNIYNKPRLVKIHKKEAPEKRASSDVDFHRCKSKPDTKCEKTRIETDTSEKKTAGWRLNKSTESVPRKVRRTPKRIPATHNFVYEFNPLGNSASALDGKSTAKGLQNLCNFGQGDTSIKQNSSNVQVHTAAALPKLQSHCDSVQSNPKKPKDMSNYNKNMNLPHIKRHEGGMDQGLTRNCSEMRNRNSMNEIDREVEEVKSDWRMLRSDSGWTRGKTFNPNSRTKKLCETLEKMTREISKIEKSYLNPKSNQFLQRASKALDVPQPSFEEEAHKIRDVLFPKGNAREKLADRKIAEETLSSIPGDALEKILSREAAAKTVNTNKQLDTRSLISNPRARNAKNLKSGNHLASKLDKRNTNEIRLKSSLINDKRTSREMSADIERYLEQYIDNVEKNFVNEEKSRAKDLHPSPDDMTEMLKKLNLEAFDMYDTLDSRDDSEKDFSSNSVRKVENMRLENCLRAAINGNTVGKKVCKETTTQYVSPKRDDDSVRENRGLCFDTSIQTNIKFPSKNNAFIGMNLGTLNTNMPQNTLSRILQSEYLKKDVSLKPM